MRLLTSPCQKISRFFGWLAEDFESRFHARSSHVFTVEDTHLCQKYCLGCVHNVWQRGGGGQVKLRGIGKNIFNKNGDGKFLDQKSGGFKKSFAFISKHNSFIS